MTTHTIVERADLFYGRWQHKLKGFQPEFSCLRRMEHGYIDKIIHARRSWGQTMRQRQPGSWYWGALTIDDDTVQNLHSMCDFLLSNTVERKMVIAQSWFYIYSDDLDFLGNPDHFNEVCSRILGALDQRDLFLEQRSYSDGRSGAPSLAGLMPPVIQNQAQESSKLSSL